MNCLECNIEFTPKRDSARYCSPNCRLKYNRKVSVSQNDIISVSLPKELSVSFRFTVKVNSDKEEFVKFAANIVREAKYWYDVPLGAIPKLEKDWPPMPDFMNGRQYFLWWKNNFEKNDKDEPVILNPYPFYDKLEYKQGGEGSRHWGM